jgi:hypothetical protein
MKANENNAQDAINDRKLHAEVPSQSSPGVTSTKPNPKEKGKSPCPKVRPISTMTQ